jgi:hypothetical protein
VEQDPEKTEATKNIKTSRTGVYIGETSRTFNEGAHKLFRDSRALRVIPHGQALALQQQEEKEVPRFRIKITSRQIKEAIKIFLSGNVTIKAGCSQT